MNKELGQLIMTGISGSSLTKDEENFIQKNNIGGVLLFSHNFESPAQLAELCNQIQTLRDDYPLLIAVDQEGGRVQRFTGMFQNVPSMLELAKLNSPKTVFETVQIMAQELRACGVNTNLAPVCDVLYNSKNNVIGDRSFGKSSETVSKFVSSVIRGLQTNGLISCAKHFPGHGSTTKDSHFDLPIINTDLEKLEKNELPSFIKAIKSKVATLMMAHLIVDCFSTELPCSLCPEAYKYVREKLKFDRVIITDDIQMKAITDNFDKEKACLQAIIAGADIVEYRDLEMSEKALIALQEANKTKQLKNDRVHESFQRVLSLKKEYLSKYKPIYIPDVEKVFSSQKTQVFFESLKLRLEQANQKATT